MGLKLGDTTVLEQYVQMMEPNPVYLPRPALSAAPCEHNVICKVCVVDFLSLSGLVLTHQSFASLPEGLFPSNPTRSNIAQ